MAWPASPGSITPRSPCGPSLCLLYAERLETFTEAAFARCHVGRVWLAVRADCLVAALAVGCGTATVVNGNRLQSLSKSASPSTSTCASAFPNADLFANLSSVTTSHPIATKGPGKMSRWRERQPAP
jgi:hypothetical protein